MKAIHIIALITVFTAASAFFLNQSRFDGESVERGANGPGAEVPLVATNSATQRRILKEAESQNSMTSASGRNSAPSIIEAPEHNNLEDLYRLVSDNEDYPTLASRIEAIKNRRPTLDINPEAILKALEKTESWEATQYPLAKVASKLTEEELNDGRSFLEFDPIKVETLMPGDQMSIAIDDLGSVYEMTVENVEDFYDGNLMWRGTLLNVEGTEAEGGAVTITQSSNITIASVVLRDKHYTVESFGTHGWIADSSILWKIDPNRSDATIPFD